MAERAEPPVGLPGGIEGGGENEHGGLGVGHGRRDEEELVDRERRGEGCDAAPLLGLPEIPNADILHQLRSDLSRVKASRGSAGSLQELTTLPRLTSHTHLVKEDDPL